MGLLVFFYFGSMALFIHLFIYLSCFKTFFDFAPKKQGLFLFIILLLYPLDGYYSWPFLYSSLFLLLFIPIIYANMNYIHLVYVCRLLSTMPMVFIL